MGENTVMNETNFQDQSRIDAVVRATEEERGALLDLREYLHENYGIFFKDKKLYSLENKVNKRMQQLPVNSIEEYERYLKNHPNELPNFLDKVSTNKTEFFREREHWNYLVNRILPDWQNRTGRLKAWSVACSTGEEPYTLAMLLDDYLLSGGEGFQRSTSPKYNILASDISRSVLNETKTGHYDRDQLKPVRNVRPEYINKYFVESDGQYAIVEDLKERITLRRFNLNTSVYPFKNSFDLILSRNVLIYFDKDMIQHVIDQLSKALKEGGYLFVGHTESLREIDHHLDRIQPAIFRKR